MTITSEGRKLLRLEVRNSETPIERKPSWIRTRVRTGPHYTELKGLVRSGGLHTVSEEAGCPNIYECWERLYAETVAAPGKELSPALTHLAAEGAATQDARMSLAPAVGVQDAAPMTAEGPR